MRMGLKFFFTREDYDAFCRRIAEVEQKVKKYTLSVGTAVDSSGDAWHDALLYDAQRMSESWSNELRNLLGIKRQAEIIEMSPPKDGKVCFGKVVKVLNLESKEVSLFKISSYVVAGSANQEEIRKISYMSPLGKLLIGAEVGEVREGVVGNNKKRFEILEIEESQ